MTTEPAACRLQRVDGRKLLPLGLGVTALFVLAGIASHGRPLAGGSRGTGPTAPFFDYVFTTLVLMAVAIAVAFVYLLLTTDTSRPKQLGHRWHVVSALLTMAVSAAVAVLILHTGFAQRFRELAQQVKPGQPAQKRQVQPPGKNVRPARVRWDEVGIVIALLAGTTVLLVAGRRARRAPRPLRRRSQEAVSLALDESLDDLRNEPDLRRAIIAAYARMERALAGAGIPRDAAEAPFEYLERALRSLDTSAAAVQRLTDLFEWAKFSQHEPEPQMRDEAVDALVAVRDELRRPVEAAVA